MIYVIKKKEKTLHCKKERQVYPLSFHPPRICVSRSLVPLQRRRVVGKREARRCGGARPVLAEAGVQARLRRRWAARRSCERRGAMDGQPGPHAMDDGQSHSYRNSVWHVLSLFQATKYGEPCVLVEFCISFYFEGK